MENYYCDGELADVVRGGGAPAAAEDSDWQFPSNALAAFSPSPGDGGFGDPFSSIRDPLFNDLGMEGLGSGFIEETAAAGEEWRGGCSFFSRSEGRRAASFNDAIFSSISTDGDGLGDLAAVTAAPGRMISTTSLEEVAINGVGIGGGIGGGGGSPPPSALGGLQLQISSPRNPGGDPKRRKNQAKKVICIPAPAPVSCRPSSGEVVPSDLWAWRKYGQKPIKGSPYPRGYYKCSSSKGCSARKQVERSRSDPNMLVITYTSEHNHPWPTQRNALAGSARLHPLKTAVTKAAPPPNPLHVTALDGGDGRKDRCDSCTASGEAGTDDSWAAAAANATSGSAREDEPGEGFHRRRLLLGETEADSMDHLRAAAWMFGAGEGEGRAVSPVDPFAFLDWPTGNSSAFGESR